VLRLEEVAVLQQDSEAPQSVAAAVVHGGRPWLSNGADARLEARHQGDGHLQHLCGARAQALGAMLWGYCWDSLLRFRLPFYRPHVSHCLVVYKVEIVDPKRFLLKMSTPSGSTLLQCPSEAILIQLHQQLLKKMVYCLQNTF
jgi:hypothetical protein